MGVNIRKQIRTHTHTTHTRTHTHTHMHIYMVIFGKDINQRIKQLETYFVF